MEDGDLDVFALQSLAQRYAKAWCSDDADRVAGFYAETGSLQVNVGEAAVGRDAIAAVAQGFIDAFPDMTVCFDRLEAVAGRLHFHWTLAGTNVGSGRFVRISGYEDWLIGADGLISQSLGHFDDVEYDRQLRDGA